MATDLDGLVILITGTGRHVEPVRHRLQGGGAAVESPDPAGTDEAWAEALGAIERRHGRLDAVVNLGRPSGKSALAEQSLAQFRAGCTGLVHTAFLAAKHGAALIRKGGRGGAIVTLCGLTARHGAAGYGVASAADGGLRLLTKALALELGPENIRATAILAGTAAHPDGSAALDAAALAEAVAFLVSARADYWTGADLTLDGGLTGFGLLAGAA